MDSFGGDNDFFVDMDPILLDATPLAYVRPVTTPEGTSYAVCTADGTQLALFSTHDAAWFAAKQHDLDPVRTH